MQKLIKQSGILFLIALTLILSLVLPQPSQAATPKTLSQKWKLQLSGEPLFEPIVQKDGTLLHGNYNVVKGVYDVDVMALDDKGKKKKSWKVKATRVDLGGTKSSPQILSLDYTKGSIKSYSTSGKRLWTYELKQKVDRYKDYYQIDKNGNLYFYVKGTIYKISPKGKLVYKKSLSLGYDSTIRTADDGSFYIFKMVVKDRKTSYLRKYDQNGQLKWDKKIFLNDEDAQYLNYLDVVEVDGSVYLSATYAKETEDNYEQFNKFISLDTDGNIKWSKNLGKDYYIKIKALNDGNTIILTNTTYYQLDAAGEALKEVKIIDEVPSENGEDYDANRIFDAVFSPNGEVYILTKESLLKVQLDGTITWDNEVNFTAYYMQMLNDYLAFTPESGDKLLVYSTDGSVVGQFKVSPRSYYNLLTYDSKKKTLYVAARYMNTKTYKIQTNLYAVKL